MPKKQSHAALLKKLQPQATGYVLPAEAAKFIHLVNAGERPLPSITSLIRVLIDDLGVALSETALRKRILKIVGRTKW